MFFPVPAAVANEQTLRLYYSTMRALASGMIRAEAALSHAYKWEG